MNETKMKNTTATDHEIHTRLRELTDEDCVVCFTVQKNKRTHSGGFGTAISVKGTLENKPDTNQYRVVSDGEPESYAYFTPDEVTGIVTKMVMSTYSNLVAEHIIYLDHSRIVEQLDDRVVVIGLYT